MSERRYALSGRTPARVVTPQTVAEIQDIVRQAGGGSQAIVPWGGGMRQHLGYPPARYDLALCTGNLDAVLDYQPADLTVTAQAGVTVAQLQQTLAANGQFLPVDVAHPERQTLGGVVATRADSLRRLAYGSVRDSLIGVSVVNAQAELIKGGGKVVKNVSGYDLPKLYCGSFGTLGLIVEATFKVAPMPEASATVVVPLDADHNSEDFLDGLLGSDLVPAFLILLNPPAAQGLLGERAIPGQMQYLALGFDGPGEAVAWQVDTLEARDGLLTLDEAVGLRERLRDFSLAGAPMTASFHILSSQVGAFTRMIEWTARRAGFAARVLADVGVGLVRAHFDAQDEPADWAVFYKDLKDKADRVGGSFIIERMPDALREAEVPVWSPVLPDFMLMARLKEALDPARLWNPGRFINRL